MNSNNYTLYVTMRLLVSLLPLVLGWPMLAFCFCAFNLVMITVTRGGVYGGLVSTGAALAGGLLCLACGYGGSFGIFFALQLLLASSLCSLTCASRMGFYAGLLACSAGYGAGEVMSYKFMADKAGLSIADYIFSGIQPAFDSAQAALSQSKEPGAEIYAGLAKKIIDAASAVIRGCIPAFIIISAIVAGYIMMWLVSRNLRGTPMDNGHSFAGLRLTVPTLCFGAVMLGLIFVPSDAVRLVGINGVTVFLFLSFCAGLSLTDFLLRLKVKNTGSRLLIHAGIFLAGALLSAIVPVANVFLIYIIMGIVDSFASIRKKVTPQP